MPGRCHCISGKTGTTNERGTVLFYMKKTENNPYISVIMGAGDKPTLYIYVPASLPESGINKYK